MEVPLVSFVHHGKLRMTHNTKVNNFLLLSYSFFMGIIYIIAHLYVSGLLSSEMCVILDPVLNRMRFLLSVSEAPGGSAENNASENHRAAVFGPALCREETPHLTVIIARDTNTSLSIYTNHRPITLSTPD